MSILPTIESLKREVTEWASRARTVREEERRAADVENRQLRAQLEAERAWRGQIEAQVASVLARARGPVVIHLKCQKCGHVGGVGP